MTATKIDPRLVSYGARWKCPSFVTSLWHQRLLAWGPGLLVNWKDLNWKVEKCANKKQAAHHLKILKEMGLGAKGIYDPCSRPYRMLRDSWVMVSLKGNKPR